MIVALILGGLSTIPLQAQEIITSIVAIQSQSSTEDDSALVGERVTIEGIATGIYGDLFFVQEPAGGPWSGIAVYAPDPAVTVGDAVRVTGRVTEY